MCCMGTDRYAPRDPAPPVHELRRIDLNLLVVLDVLLAERSVSRAAERLAMTQSAVSHALGRLRELLGDPILVRVGNAMRISAQAQTLRAPLAEALARVREVVLPAAFDPGASRRAFRLSMSDYGCDVVLGRLLPELRRLAPGIDLVVTPGGRLEVLRQVAEGELDGALGVFPMLPAELNSDVLFDEHFVVITGAANLAPDGSLDLERYLAAPHLHVSAEELHHSHVDKALAALGLARRLALVVPYWKTALALLRDTDLMLTVAARTVPAGQLPAGLAMVAPPIALPGFAFVYLWRADTAADAAAMWLRAKLRALQNMENQDSQVE